MKYLFSLLFFSLLLLEAKEYKAVFDCSSKDMGFVSSRMILVERTMQMIEKNSDIPKFAITVHGGCAPIVSKNYDEIILDDKELEHVKRSQEQLVKLAEKGVEIVVCAMSLNANTIPKEDVIPSVSISQNSFIDTIGYQNNGYALMTFK